MAFSCDQDLLILHQKFVRTDMRLLLTIISLFVAVRLPAQLYWQQPIVNYTRQQYLAGSQNWMICQHPCGWMYFANNNGLLEFDGNLWNLYPMANEAKLRSVMVGKDGRIYVGGQREFGFFKPNRLGGLSYTSLAGSASKDHSLNIWKVLEYQNSIYFQGDQKFYRYSRGRLCAIDCNGASFSEVVNNRIYFTNDFGLSYLKNGKPVVIPGSRFLTQSYTCALLPMHGQLLIATNENFYCYDGKRIVPALQPLHPYISGHFLTCAAISGNTLAIGTADNGLLLYDLRTQQVEHISIANGLQNKSVISMKFDRERNLWLGLDNGIDCIPLNSPISFLSSRQTSIGAGYCSLWQGARLFLGTNEGVYVANEPVSKSQVSLKSVPGLRGQAHCLYAFDGKVFCGGRRFLAISDGQRTTFCPQRGVWHIQVMGTQTENALLLGTYWGLEVMRKIDGQWVRTNDIGGFNISAKSMFVEPESNNVWVANKTDGLWRVTLNLGLTRVLRKKKYNSRLLPQGENVYVTRIGHNVVVASHHGLLRYDPQADRLVPFTTLENQLDGPAHVYTYIAQDSLGRLWYVCDGTLKCQSFSKSGGRYVRSFLSDNMISDFENVNATRPNTVIAGTEDGFVMLDMTKSMAAATKAPMLQIRRLYTTSDGDSLVFGRSYQRDDFRPELDYHHNSVRILWSCCNLDRGRSVAYSYRLRGLSDRWSEYSATTMKEYTRLHEGSYTFEVKAKTANGCPTVTTSLRFIVLPPWYRSWWAYTIYAMLSIAAFVYLYKAYKESRLRLVRQKDEELSKQRSIYEQDLNRKKQQIDELEAEKLRSELHHKSDELMKTTLNVVRKNEMLQTIKKDAEKLNDKIGKDTLPNLRRGMLRLISQIDTNIEHDNDLDNFRVSFDAVHKDFFAKLDHLFPQLTHKDKMLCAYIRMDLLSKEIAPLLNISIRGVEISRYRLRKKMGLDTNVNLSEFLHKL